MQVPSNPRARRGAPRRTPTDPTSRQHEARIELPSALMLLLTLTLGVVGALASPPVSARDHLHVPPDREPHKRSSPCKDACRKTAKDELYDCMRRLRDWHDCSRRSSRVFRECAEFCEYPRTPRIVDGRAGEDAGEEGVNIALELIEGIRQFEGVSGIHIMAVGWESIVPRIVKDAGLLAPDFVAPEELEAAEDGA